MDVSTIYIVISEEEYSETIIVRKNNDTFIDLGLAKERVEKVKESINVNNYDYVCKWIETTANILDKKCVGKWELFVDQTTNDPEQSHEDNYVEGNAFIRIDKINLFGYPKNVKKAL